MVHCTVHTKRPSWEELMRDVQSTVERSHKLIQETQSIVQRVDDVILHSKSHANLLTTPSPSQKKTTEHPSMLNT